jgi:hypothetical protein
MTSKMILCLDYTSPGDLKCDNFAWRLQGLHRAATSALKGLRRARQQPLSGRESVERDDELTMMEAMANPKKTAAVYFAMAEAKSARDGRATFQIEISLRPKNSVEHSNRRPCPPRSFKRRSASPGVARRERRMMFFSRVKPAPTWLRDFRIDLRDLDRLIDSNTKLFALSAVSMATGFQHDLKAPANWSLSRRAGLRRRRASGLRSAPERTQKRDRFPGLLQLQMAHGRYGPRLLLREGGSAGPNA